MRRLQEGFREHIGVTPLEHLRNVRLDRVHAQLTGDGPPAAVTDIAYRWGFTHPGRFAADYRRRFGIGPAASRRASVG